MKKTYFFFFCITLISLNGVAQFSKTHYIPPLAKTSTTGEYFIYLSTPTSSDVDFKIHEIGGSTISGTINNNSPFQSSLSETQLFVPPTQMGKFADKGFLVEAEDMIYVSVRVNADLRQDGEYLQGGGIVSKGNSALGKEFRLGAMLNPVNGPQFLNFASVLSTENGTEITISNIADGTILTDGTTVNGPFTITLDKNESYTLAMGNHNDEIPSNSSKIIGALVESDKPVVVNSGSYAGTNSSRLNNQGNAAGRDIGFDQIVPFERTGKEYIFVKGLGDDDLEQILLVAHRDDTEIFLNGSASPFTTINRGEYTLIDGSNYIDGNLYVSTSEDVFAYQSIGGQPAPPNQNLFFVPPLNCATPTIVDNIPYVESIGNITFNGGLNIVTETGAAITLNGNPINTTPVAVEGNPDYVRYSVDNLTGNIAVESTKQVYVSYFGNNGVATYGGYYSGFDTKPEIITEEISASALNCIPNVNLKISSFSSYDSFQWYFNDRPISGATENTYTPTQPGYYQVEGRISGCGTSSTLSDRIPVSSCPEDSDNDGANNNIDIDLDNDGIINAYEADIAPLNQSDITSGSNYTGIIEGDGNIVGKPEFGFVSEVQPGESRTVSYTLNLEQPQTLSLSYIEEDNEDQTTDFSELMNAEGDFIIRVPPDKTLTLLDPDNQLLVDTNYDGIYESGVNVFSSFEIRFRLRSTTPLTPGEGTFSISSYLTDSFTIVHNNLSDTSSNSAPFMITQTEPYDSDSDSVPDLLDADSDNDGIPDFMEARGEDFEEFSGVDSNGDGLDDAFEPGPAPIDTDGDGVPDYLDLDSDNDGIFDLVESGSNAPDSDRDGVIDGQSTDFGTNGLFNDIETSPNNGQLASLPSDSDEDGVMDYIELDSDNDSCFDVIEAGFQDEDENGTLGTTPDNADLDGVITGLSYGYTEPADKDDNGIYDFQEENILKAGTDTEATFCSNEDPIDLFDYLGEEADIGGTWNPEPQSGTGIFDPKTDTSGTFTYTVNNGACGRQSASIEVEVHKDPDAGEDAQIELCSADNPVDLFEILGGNPDVNGSWSPELTGDPGIFDPESDTEGIFTYTVENESCSNASAQVAVKVTPTPDAGKNATVNTCINANAIDLFEHLEGDPQPGGTWTPSLDGNGRLDPAVDSEGVYTYTVDSGKCGQVQAEVVVNIQEPFPITDYEIKTTEFSDNNSIEILVNSDLDFEYSLDGESFQNNNTFYAVQGGEHDISVREIDGCGYLDEKVIILDYPKFFSPNNDGYNDNWKIKGAEGSYEVKIFDRYGKLLKILNPNQSWDGTFNNKKLPTDDYWFELRFKDGTKKTGHFSLVR